MTEIRRSVHVCKKCGRNASIAWWKCCIEHTTEDGPDVVCDYCLRELHPKDETQPAQEE